MSHRLHIIVGLAVAALAVGCADGTPTAPEATKPLEINAHRSAPTFEIDTFVVEGAVLTQPQGINADGDIVGWYNTADKRSHGFIRRRGSITTVDYRKSDGTYADNTTLRGIGPDGQAVGTYRDNEEEAVASHGFRRTRYGVLIPVRHDDDDVEYNLVLQRILPDGTILGCLHLHDQMESMRGIEIAGGRWWQRWPRRGFRWWFARSGDSGSDSHEVRADWSARGRLTAIDTAASMHNGATPDGRVVVGFYTPLDGMSTLGYVIEHGHFRPFSVPGSTNTFAWDINARGDIVGVYTDAAGAHGYVRTREGYTTIDVPGASATRAFGINARGDIVGSYTKDGVTRGFIARHVH